MPATPAWLAAAEALLNRGIEGSEQAKALARRLEATAVMVDIEGFIAVRAGVAHGRLGLAAVSPAAERPTRATDSSAAAPAAAGSRAPPAPAERADATIQGSPAALLHLLRGGANRGAARAPAQIRGNAEIADSYRQLFALARPDLEDELSRIVGDLPARRVAQIATRTVAWARKVQRTAGENIAEYLQEESRDLVNKPELEEFLHGVDALREAADRVEARLARLEQRVKGSN